MPQHKPHRARTITPRRGSTTARFLRDRRHDAATHLLRGTCYGLGTGLVSLAVWWIQQHP
ncbi:hypothetical protein [Streptomyces sp. NPDC029674]|uniref:hypothetical protein n=1 Tax=Streptomyces sp. NPDC029674 TaxID=3365297 RepID=UPI00384F9B3A